MQPLKVALVHDWLTGMRGGEAVLEAMVEMFASPELFTLVCFKDAISESLRNVPTHTSFLQRIPGVRSKYRHFLPIMPRAIESLDLSKFDLVISSSHCVAKGVHKRPDAVHVSYIHAPMRYMWDRYEEYFGPGVVGPVVRWTASLMRPRLQAWDRRSSSADRIQTLIGNSLFIGDRIEEFYGRKAKVIYPFAHLERFALPRVMWNESLQGLQPDLMVGAFAPYKRVDLAIQAYNRLGRPLWIVGSGQDEKRLRKLAAQNVKFLGPVPNEKLVELYSQCRAFVFPGKEDFGITPLEAMATGMPVIAFGEGGGSETVTEMTGVFFKEQTVESLLDALVRFESRRGEIREENCRARAGEFSKTRFQKELSQVIRESWKNAGKDEALLNQVLTIRV